MSEGFSAAGVQEQGSASTQMQPRLIKGLQAEYEPSVWTGENTSGLTPFGTHILVRMDQCSVTSSGGVMLPDEICERMDEASESGCIFAMTPQAYMSDDWGRPWQGPRPKVGDRVYIERYSGVKARGADGALYRMMTRNCIVAGRIDDQEQPQ